MFTGIIEGIGKIKNIVSLKLGYSIIIESEYQLDDVTAGSSIAVNGVCLTAKKIQKNLFHADISPETIKKTSLKFSKIGDLVNLERALKLFGRIDGHMVSGHIDGIGSIIYKKKIGNSTLFNLSTKKELLDYLIEKGSIAIDGVSLTINSCSNIFFSVCVVPHSFNKTIFKNKKVGDLVNIELDLIGKYIEKFLKNSIKKC